MEGKLFGGEYNGTNLVLNDQELSVHNFLIFFMSTDYSVTTPFVNDKSEPPGKEHKELNWVNTEAGG